MLYRTLSSGEVRTIITDVTMVASGIRKGALERLGLEVKCYLSDERTAEMAARMNITRTQAGIRLAVEEHPEALYVFGNAPTALTELCALMRRGKARPVGVVGAPVGFVNVKESKYMLKSFIAVPKIIIEGRKGVVTWRRQSLMQFCVLMMPDNYCREGIFKRENIKWTGEPDKWKIIWVNFIL